MALKIAVSIDDHFADFIDAQVQSGRFGSASDVIKAGLRLLEEHEAKANILMDALIVGEGSGQPAPFNSRAFLERMRTKYT